MLPGMEEPHRQWRDSAAHSPDDRGYFHEIRARPYDTEYGRSGDTGWHQSPSARADIFLKFV
jgi:hypothetical protein